MSRPYSHIVCCKELSPLMIIFSCKMVSQATFLIYLHLLFYLGFFLLSGYIIFFSLFLLFLSGSEVMEEKDLSLGGHSRSEEQ